MVPAGASHATVGFMATDDRSFVDDLMLHERWTEAIAYLEARPELVQSDYQLCWTLGWAHFKQAEFVAACRFLQQAAQMAPEEYAGHFALGTVYLELGKYNEAESSLRTALGIRDTSLARLTLALVYMEQGRSDEAEQVHLDGIAADPKSVERWEAYGDFLSDQGRGPEAEEAYARAKSLLQS